MPKIKCPNCKKAQRIKGKYEDMLDEKITCKKCNFIIAGFCWEYIPKKKEKIEKESISEDKDSGFLVEGYCWTEFPTIEREENI